MMISLPVTGTMVVMTTAMRLFMMVVMTAYIAMPSPVPINRCCCTFRYLYLQDPAYFLKIVQALPAIYG